jgi:hypothetical protein
MTFSERSLDDYVDVATRIAEFRAKYPDGYLAPLGSASDYSAADPYRIQAVQGFDKNGEVVQQTFVVVVAAAYRQPGDTSPGVGMAWEVFPGRTPYTRGSELMNAETRAWGRAIIALGAADAKRGIASAEEVRNRQAERSEPVDTTPALPRTGTDASLRDQGRMDRKQKSAHEHLAADTVRPGRGEHVERSHPRGPADDEWTTEPADENTPGTSQLGQQQAIAITLGGKGITDRARKLAFCTQVAGRPIGSSKELSFVEARAVLAQAEALEKTEAPGAGQK